MPRGYWRAMSFMEIFQPGLKHLREEQYRRQMDVAYPTNGGNPPIDIDLDAGTATIVIRVLAAESLDAPAEDPAPIEPGPDPIEPGPDPIDPEPDPIEPERSA